jgi:hypothetical protein
MLDFILDFMKKNPESYELEELEEETEANSKEVEEEKSDEQEEKSDTPEAPVINVDVNPPKHSYVMTMNVRYNGQKYRIGDVLDNNHQAVGFFVRSGFCKPLN